MHAGRWSSSWHSRMKTWEGRGGETQGVQAKDTLEGGVEREPTELLVGQGKVYVGI